MKSILVILAIAGLNFPASARAAEMPGEGKMKCSSCHKIDEKLVGPAWTTVADKYKGRPDAEKTLIANITRGGRFGWRLGAMPPRGLGANDAEIRTLAKFILTL